MSTAGALTARLGVLGANDRVNVAVIGVRGRGREHMDLFSRTPGSCVAALCDVDTRETDAALAVLEKSQSMRPKVYQDLRKLLEDKDVDAVSIATCNHWHALATIWACQAGKDVYVEKPASHNVWEGRRMVEAARKYDRIVQTGMQSRSIEHKKRAIALLREGVIGNLYMAKGLCFKRRRSIGRGDDGHAPDAVDYDLWRGPAPMRAFNANRFHYNWHWFWETGNGDIGNQGVHEMDFARWGLGKTTHPKRVLCSGGKFVYDDDQETPNTQTATFDYGDCQLVFEVRGLLTGGECSIAYDGSNFIGNLFFGSEGFMSVDLEGFQIYKGEKRELVDKMEFTEPRKWDTAPLVANFLDAVRSRRQADLTADIEQGHLSAALCHLANASYRTGRALDFDPATETFGGDTEADGYLSREYRKPFEVPANV
jgi:predicted dehydrogenase